MHVGTRGHIVVRCRAQREAARYTSWHPVAV